MIEQMSGNLDDVEVDPSSERNFAVLSDGAQIVLGYDIAHDEQRPNAILKKEYAATDELDDLTWRSVDHSTLLQCGEIFPNDIVIPVGTTEEKLIDAIYKNLPSNINDDISRSTFIDRVSTGEPPTLTVRLGGARFISKIGLSFSPWDRHPNREIRVEVGMLEWVNEENAKLLSLSTLPIGTTTCPNCKMHQPIVKILIGEMDPGYHMHDEDVIRTTWIEFEPRWINCIRLHFHWEGTRVYFLYAIGPKSIWHRWGWLLKLMALLQMGRATVAYPNSTPSGKLHSVDTNEDLFFAQLMYGLTFLGGVDKASPLSPQLSSILRNVFEFL